MNAIEDRLQSVIKTTDADCIQQMKIMELVHADEINAIRIEQVTLQNKLQMLENPQSNQDRQIQYMSLPAHPNNLHLIMKKSLIPLRNCKQG